MPSHKVELTPGSAQLIYSLARQSGMSLTAGYSELLDNSLDAGAKSVEIAARNANHTLSISDDGSGTENVLAIITPYKHGEHAAKNKHRSGHCGIGGTVSQIYFCEGRGRTAVESRTKKWIYQVSANFGEMIDANKLEANEEDPIPNDTGETGTTITVFDCMKITPQQIRAAVETLSWRFTPSLRRGVQIILTLDDKDWILDPTPMPEFKKIIPFNFEVYGLPVEGHCRLVKPGQQNRARGWAVIFGHRILKTTKEPAGNRQPDWNRLYSEVQLGREWRKRINDHKDDFVVDPTDLWDRLGEICGPILDQLERESRIIELKESTQAVQDILDAATGHGRWKSARDGVKNPGIGPVVPTNNGKQHEDAEKKQDGPKPVGKSRDRRRIYYEWTTQIDVPYKVEVTSRRIDVALKDDYPPYMKYKPGEAAPFLADHILHVIASDLKIMGKEHYAGWFPGILAEEVPMIFREMLDAVEERAAVATV